MNIKLLFKQDKSEIAGLMESAFALSEGEGEGKLIGNLASELSSKIDDEQIICFGGYENNTLVSAIFFTRLWFNESILVYMLSPVAVKTEYQRKGIGQTLIEYGLNELRNRSVAVVITYGDPSFYSKVGFHSLSEDVIKAPLKLSIPHGWLGQSLTKKPIPVIYERPKCVEAFYNPAYW